MGLRCELLRAPARLWVTWIGCAFIVCALHATRANAAEEAQSWATTQAAELTRQGAAHTARGDPATATRRLLEAISFDPTYGPAYLALASLYEGAGDVVEAERVYEAGLERVTAFAEGHAARGTLLRRLGRLREATLDFEAALSISPDEPSLLEALAATYIGLGALPAALSASRRLEVVAESRADAAMRDAARARSRALAALLSEVDPVTAGERDRGVLRRTLARRVRRGR